MFRKPIILNVFLIIKKLITTFTMSFYSISGTIIPGVRTYRKFGVYFIPAQSLSKTALDEEIVRTIQFLHLFSLAVFFSHILLAVFGVKMKLLPPCCTYKLNLN